ncbi:hypothetical protein D9623_05250 [Azospirillum brasilense]|uniref:Uncharacterized protein n=1 Tax=Azospirillum brasilense TaxID=192 RepID=A0A0P0EL91_AZOBR|nr:MULTISPECIES: hypothetical protein [Azospirillum]ALJ34686.1 hypothetical protein AMK58_04195 [Azospirillum brasilense]MDW7554789.1 hypothetical protein [Azospirillum brasilense]MDW7557212.1 hypothetical protein [Azospirillum brasilense]MDW7593088.1 hypothetical protein [Azospirillum brasilense]MDW7626961.1 hypothetical protein [Azospirillum brasilense]
MTARRLNFMKIMVPLVLASALWAGPVGAAETPPPPGAAPPPGAPSTPGEQARQGVELLMKALEGWVRQVPMFAPPEVTPEGDIVIRRLDRSRPAPAEPAPPKSEPPVPNAPTDL